MAAPDATPAGVVITATKPNGETINVTAGVQTLYDHLIHSMDWGSGFLTAEDALPIVEIAKACGFKDYEEAERYVAAAYRTEKQRKCAHPSWRLELGNVPGYLRKTCDECGLVAHTTEAEERGIGT